MNGRSDHFEAANPGWVLALSIGLFATVLIRGGLWLVTGSAPDFEQHWPGMIFHAVLITGPFGFLAIRRVSAKIPWIAAAILTAMVWAFYLAVPAAQPQDGNDLGAALLLLLSPFAITAGAFAADRLARRTP